MAHTPDSRIKLLLVGPYPPPFGGISATVHDLYQFLRKQAGVDVSVMDIGENRHVEGTDHIRVTGVVDFVMKVCRFARKGFVVHLETNGHNSKSWQSALVCAIAGLFNGHRTIVAFGSGMLPDYLSKCTWLQRMVVKLTVRWAGWLICRNEEMVQALCAHGALRDKVLVVPGFVGLAGRSPQPIPAEVDRFCRAHDPVLGVAALLSPEYGLPLALQALAEIRNSYFTAGLVVVGIGPEARDTLTDLKPIQEHVLLAGVLPPDVALGVMGRLNVFLRPTYFDGDSVSVREAMALGVPVVASATGTRPNVVETFPVGDKEALCQKVVEVLARRVGEDGSRISREDSGSALTLFHLYQRLAGPQPCCES